MESVDKLREKIRKDVNNPWSDLKGDLLSLVDKVEAEIADCYMELPVDADGVPIRVGDKLIGYNERFDVEGIGDGTVLFRTEDDGLGELFNPVATIHVKPRTLTDVLADLFERKMSVTDAECEIRELMGGDAE